MTQKEIKIKTPEGYEIDKVNSTFEKIVFKEIKKSLPKRWEDIKIINGYFIDDYANIKKINCKTNYYCKSVFPTKKLAEAALALSQLLQLRDIYNDGWVPDFDDIKIKWCVKFYGDKITTINTYYSNSVLVFKSSELAEEFKLNFLSLIEIAKSLL